MDALRDPIWGFIGVVVGTAVTIMVAWRFRSHKALSYEIVSSGPLVTVTRNAKGEVTQDLEIRYKGNEVRDLQVVVVRLWNSGNVPIVETDYRKPIQFEFGGSLLAYDVIEAEPSHLRESGFNGAGSSPTHCGVQLKPIDLNQGSSLTIQVLLTNFDGTIEPPKGYILGVRKIQPAGKSNRFAAWISAHLGILSLLYCLSGFLGFVYIGISGKHANVDLGYFFLGTAFSILPGALLFAGFLRMRRA